MSASTRSSAVQGTRAKRPFGVTLLAALVLSIAGLHLIRFIQALKTWDFLAGLPGVSPLYLALSGLVVALVGFPLAWGLWRGMAWAARFTRIAALVYILQSWFDRTFLAQEAFQRTNWPFALAATFLLLVWVFFILSRPQAKAFFGDIYE